MLVILGTVLLVLISWPVLAFLTVLLGVGVLGGASFLVAVIGGLLITVLGVIVAIWITVIQRVKRLFVRRWS